MYICCVTPERNMYHVLMDTQRVVKIVSKFQVPCCYGLGVKVS